MSGINNKYDIQLEILTPLNVGAGNEKDWVEGTDYVVKKGVLYKLNIRKMVNAGVDIELLSSYFASKNSKGILNILENNLTSVSDYTLSMPAATSNDIKSFVKNQLSGNPIVPGSSLKGAIRSILFNYLRDDEKNEKDVFGSSDKGDEFMRFVKLSDVEFAETQLVNTKIFNLKKSDSEWKGGWKHAFKGNDATTEKFDATGFNTIYEVLMPGEKGCGSIMFSEKVFDLFDHNSFYSREMQEIKNGLKKKEVVETIKSLQSKVESKTKVIKDVSLLFSIINFHTKRYLEKEKAFFKAYPAEHSNEIVNGIDNLLKQIPSVDSSDNSFCIFKMAAGSGFHSITGDWQQVSDDYINTGIWKFGRNVGKMKYKSRKIATDGSSFFSLMGFVKMSILTPEQLAEYKERKETLRKEREEERKLLVQKRKEGEKREKHKQQTLLEYNSVIEKANKFHDSDDLEKALDEYKRAATIFPEGKKHIERIVEVEDVLKVRSKQREFEEKQRQQAIKEQQRRENRLEQGLFFLEEKNLHGKHKVTDFKGAKRRIEQWLRQSKNSVTPEDQDDILATALKRIYGSMNKDKEKKLWNTFKEGVWKDVIKWVGETRAKSIYDYIFD